MEGEDKLALKSPDPTIGVGELGASAVIFYVYVYAKSENYLKLRMRLNEKIKIGFDENNIEIPYLKILKLTTFFHTMNILKSFKSKRAIPITKNIKYHFNRCIPNILLIGKINIHKINMIYLCLNFELIYKIK